MVSQRRIGFFFLENGGEIKKIKKGVLFQKEGYLFEDFSKEMQKQREKNINNKKIFKGIIVSLYGRLGMSQKTNKTILIQNKKEYENILEKSNITSKTWINEKKFIGIIEIEITEEQKSINSNAFYAGLITAKGRILLLKAMKETTKNNGRLLYVDTDSIFAAFSEEVNKEKFKIIKWEETKIKDCVFVSTKMYSLKFNDGTFETKISGLLQNSLSFEEFFKKFYSYKNPLKYNTILNKTSTYQFIEKKIEKYIDFHSYDKRKFDKMKKKN